MQYSYFIDKLNSARNCSVPEKNLYTQVCEISTTRTVVASQCLVSNTKRGLFNINRNLENLVNEVTCSSCDSLSLRGINAHSAHTCAVQQEGYKNKGGQTCVFFKTMTTLE